MLNIFKNKTWFDDVKEFHQAFGLDINETPKEPSYQLSSLRIKLMEEEVNEYLQEEAKKDLPAIAKELADIIYIACGTAVSYGIPLDKVFAEVHKSNMNKLVNGKVIRREDGKVLKPKDWKYPDIEKVIYEQDN